MTKAAHPTVLLCSALGLWVLILVFPAVSSFSITTTIPPTRPRNLPMLPATVNGVDPEPKAIAEEDSSGEDGLFPNSLFEAALRASTPKAAETETGAHDAFRFEWGRWVDDDAVQALMTQVNEVEIFRGDIVYDRLLELSPPPSPMDPSEDEDESNDKTGRRFRVAGSDNWDCILHVLPKGTEWKGRWPTGSWAFVRALTGLAEVHLLRGPDRDGLYKQATTTKLRGGGDGTLGGGGGGGEDGIKYVGGALRSYGGAGGKTLVLEVTIRPPVGPVGIDGDGNASGDMEVFPAGDAAILRVREDTRRWKREREAAAASKDEENEDPEKKDPSRDSKGEDEATPKEDSSSNSTSLGTKLGLAFDNVGGLDDQLNDIVRRVLASRANPELARKLGVNHVRGILLSGPPGCGKTLLARELSNLLGAREPRIVNGPEILDKFIGEAEKNVRALFRPAEIEYEQLGDASALHVIVLDELDAIARKRGSVSGDSTGVRDSVVNQLLSKMDGVKEANNILVMGLTNRPELLDPALTRPGRLEVQLRVELPNLEGRRDILRIHTRHMREEGGLDSEALAALEDLRDGIPVQTEYFTGAELAGLVRSAASFAMARSIEEVGDAKVGVRDFARALAEVRPALGKQDDVLEARFPYGISPCSEAMQRLMRDIQRFTSTPFYLSEASRGPIPDGAKVPERPSSKLQSLLLVGDGYAGGTGATALACWAASQASKNDEADYCRLITSLDLLAGDSNDESARAAALVERFVEASAMPKALLVFDDIDQICAGSGPGGYSGVMLSTLRALLRSPAVKSFGSSSPEGVDRPDGGFVPSNAPAATSLSVIASTSRTDALCTILHELFDETLVVPELIDSDSIQKLFSDALPKMGSGSMDFASDSVVADMARLMADRLETVGCKTALRLLERTVSMSYRAMNEEKSNENKDDMKHYLIDSMACILDDYVRDKEAAQRVDCNVK